MANHDAMTRRDFLAATAALAAAGTLGRVAGAGAARGRATPIKVGLIGCGGRGTGAAVQALKADAGAVLWAVGDLFEDRIEPSVGNVRATLEDDGVTGAASRIDLADRRYSGFDNAARVIDSGVDVVLLCTPPAFRPEHLALAVAAGKHVFCEKPVAVDAPGVRSVLASARVARERGLCLMSGFCWRYHDQVRETFDRLHAGGIGDIHTIQTTYNTTGWVTPKPRQAGWGEGAFQLRNWQYFTPLSGDHIVEQAVHAIDWIGLAMRDQPPERCWAVGGRQTRPATPETGNVFDHFAVTYEYPGGVRAYHTCRHWPNTPADNSAYFIGSQGRCTMSPWIGQHEIEGGTPWRGTAASNDMYQREHDLLFRAIRDQRAHNDGEAMAHSTMLAIMARMAAYTGEVVTWERAMASEDAQNPSPWSLSDRAVPAVAVPGVTKFL